MTLPERKSFKRKLGTTDFTPPRSHPIPVRPPSYYATSPHRGTELPEFLPCWQPEQQKQDPFVLVLIDGDNTLFRESYVLEGAEGGYRAARDLAHDIESYIAQQIHGSRRCKVLLRLYWNLRGLSSTYIHLRSGTTHETLRAFTRAFNQERPLFESVDAGDDKEAADNKIKANFELYWHNTACQHIILAASGDRGYISFLRQYTSTPNISARLTLLEARPFHQDFDWLRQSCRSFRSAVFCTDELRHTETFFRPRTPLSLPRRTSQAVSYSVQAIEGAANQQPEFSPASRRQAGITSIEPARTLSNVPSDIQELHVFYNSASQRVDEAIERLSFDRNEMRERKLCNRFYLSKCKVVGCSKDHTADLNDSELRTLRAFARLLSCRNPHCADPCCVASHQCPGLPACPGGPQCKFGLAMHRLDTQIVRRDTFDRETLKLLSSVRV